MPFDFAHTCTDIDAGITSTKELISDVINDIIEEACPLLSGDALETFRDGYVDHFYLKLEDIFEDVRATNVDMRKEAESQIDDLDDRITDLEAELEQGAD